MTMIQSPGAAPNEDRSRPRAETNSNTPVACPAHEPPHRLAGRRRPLRVCIVSSEFLGPYRNGGIGTAYTKLGEALNVAGHDVTFLYTYGTYTHTEPVEHWIEDYGRRGIRFVPMP